MRTIKLNPLIYIVFLSACASNHDTELPTDTLYRADDIACRQQGNIDVNLNERMGAAYHQYASCMKTRGHILVEELRPEKGKTDLYDPG